MTGCCRVETLFFPFIDVPGCEIPLRIRAPSVPLSESSFFFPSWSKHLQIKLAIWKFGRADYWMQRISSRWWMSMLFSTSFWFFLSLGCDNSQVLNPRLPYADCITQPFINTYESSTWLSYQIPPQEHIRPNIGIAQTLEIFRISSRLLWRRVETPPWR